MLPPDTMTTEDARRSVPKASPVAAGRRYLLVLDGGSSALCSLPRSGTLLVGRLATADIRVEDPSVSRQHARVLVEEGGVRIEDLESHNGVRLNGERIVGAQPLRSGDVVTLGHVTLVFHCGDRILPLRPSLDATALRGRLAEEIERVLSYERVLSVIALELGACSIPMVELVREAGQGLRLMDLTGQVGSSLIVVMPELEEEEAKAAAQQLLETLRLRVPEVRAGLASAPQDGLDADALLAAARAAALAAPGGGLQVSGPSLYRLPLGGRAVLVADPSMVGLFELLRRLAPSPLPVLIHGETGAGKENAAWAVHHWSPRAGKRFLALNCAALPENLVESELFGYERGAFSGADKSREGLFEQASGGTLFLDEVAELSLAVQAKLLRALDQKRITRLGSSREHEVDLRIVAATHRVLADEVKAGRFRQDLFYRLSTAVVILPPLRERARELPLLAQAFLAEACSQAGRPLLQLSAAAMGVLAAHSWPGNVRELKSVMEYAAVTARGTIIEPSHLPASLGPPTPPAPEPTALQAVVEGQHPGESPAESARSFRLLAEEVRELERQRMSEALEATGGVQTRAAQLIGMPLRTFTTKLRQYKLPSRGR
ncbi:sigma 54-interacting transcriptional regulator [Hyalangium versicolor]|uniref:sigma 54-interacting transcriptional regulator n=1 Tax=Hyalangium versicolor TaxID=2861190 RepID=UPI001CC9AB60|nr:sigma 54-interacting transcriptional regulator [Hyalangium versicolor]